MNLAKDSEYIKVHVYAGMKQERFTATGPNRFEAIVREPASHNAANRRVTALIATAYNVQEGRIRIVSGHHSPQKILTIIQ